MSLIDTHCHLSYEDFDSDRDPTWQRAKEAGVVGLLNVAIEPACWDAYLQLAQSDPSIKASLGFHPNSAETYSEAALERLYALYDQHRSDVVAIGETGLDFFRDNCPKDVQARAFQAQLEAAEKLRLPFILHCRQAERAMLDQLKAHREQTGKSLNGVWHCFTASVAYMHEAVELGLYLGFGGVTTYKKAEEVRDALRAAPLDRILLETDAPFLAPMPNRGKRNEPAFVRDTAKRVAEERRMSLEDLAAQTTQNAQRLFGCWQ